MATGIILQTLQEMLLTERIYGLTFSDLEGVWKVIRGSKNA